MYNIKKEVYRLSWTVSILEQIRILSVSRERKLVSFQDILYAYDVDVIYRFVDVKNRFLFSIIFIALDTEIEGGKCLKRRNQSLEHAHSVSHAFIFQVDA